MPHYGYDSFCKEPFYQPELVDELLKGFVEVFFCWRRKWWKRGRRTFLLCDSV
jgi:hypothetical protein